MLSANNYSSSQSKFCHFPANIRHLPSRFIIKFNLLLLIFLLSVISLIFYMIYYDMFRRSGTETYGWKVAGRSMLPLLDPL